MYASDASALFLSSVITIVTAVISLAILYAIIRGAVVSALRKARYEARIEHGFGNDALMTWGDRAERDAIARERQFRAASSEE